MITSFANDGTQDIFDGTASKAAEKTCPKALWPVAQRKLSYLDAAVQVADLRVPPGNQLEALKGDWAGYFSIRVNQQFRVVFKFDGGNASEVQILDYH